MLANWVKETSATAGTLTTIALGGAAGTNYVPFSARLADGQQVEVTFTDGNNRQIANCTYNTAANTLTINRILENLVAGVLTLNPATPMSLSGSAIVEISASSDNVISNTLSTCSSLIGGAELADNWQASQSQVVIGSGSPMYMLPSFFISARRFSTIAFYVNTADAAATNTRFGFYEFTQSGGIGNLIFDSGDVSSLCGTSGFKTKSVTPTSLKPGRYWLAYTTGSGTLGIYGSYGSGELTGGIGSSVLAPSAIRNVGTFSGALPNPITQAGWGPSVMCAFCGLLP